MKGTKKTSKNTLIILLIVLLLALSVGYAAFSDTLHITGTANIKAGKFDLEFTSATVDKAEGCDAAGTTAVISSDKNTLTVTVKDLAYPGAGAQFTTVIKNVGTLPAKITKITPTNITGSGNIKISGLEVIDTSHPTIEPNGTCTVTFYVQFDPNYSNTTINDESVSFNLDIEYGQDVTTPFNGTTNHVDANTTT